MRTLGSRSGEPWRAAIPRGDAVGILATLDITNEAVMTLTQYHPQSTENRASGYPVIDRKSGKLIEHTRSVTVIHPDAVHASVAAHALFASSPGKWVETARLLGIEDAVITDASGVVHITDNLAERLRFVNHNTAFETISL
jgi:thiamine biosynthesis lipoprotein